jgi:16S rRNA (cytidine1402-2'-O)-methyltransferase
MALYIVATPIGNLGDITARARETLAACDGVIAEDTRHSGQLMVFLGLKKPFHSLPAFDEAARIGPLIQRLSDGESLALVTDAGTPAISDPGALLVRSAIEAGITVVPIPGASAVVAAVSVSGFPEGRFHFAGFLPRKASDRAEMLSEISSLRAQLVFYESPHRVHETLLDLSSALGDRPALVARELTKLHEELARGTLSELAQKFAEGARGEIVIVVAGAPAEAAPVDPAALEREVRERLARGERPKEIAEALAARHGKRDVYQLALRLKGE